MAAKRIEVRAQTRRALLYRLVDCPAPPRPPVLQLEELLPAHLWRPVLPALPPRHPGACLPRDRPTAVIRCCCPCLCCLAASPWHRLTATLVSPTPPHLLNPRQPTSATWSAPPALLATSTIRPEPIAPPHPGAPSSTPPAPTCPPPGELAGQLCLARQLGQLAAAPATLPKRSLSRLPRWPHPTGPPPCPPLSLSCSPKGTWNNEEAQDNCNPCAPGKYSNNLGSTECKTCAAGTYSAGQSSGCGDCRPGYFAPAGAAACSPCKPGSYAPAGKSATCKLCPKGYQCPTNAMKAVGPW